ncbi:MAG: hypothetical protein ACRD8A_02530 [Candidatus Acidiferrales bacterium]
MTIQRLLGVLLLGLSLQPVARAQSDVPIVSGGVGFVSTTNGGQQFMQPIIAPVFAAPVGDRWLFESRVDLREFIYQPGQTGPYSHQFFGTIEYGQADYTAASWLTLVAGRFLTPFNMYDEHLSPIWIRNLQDAPIIFPIGTRTNGYNDGLMARGLLVARKNYQLSYTAYFSTLSTIKKLESGRSMGTRIGVFFPTDGLELGASYQKLLQSDRSNSVGAYVSWHPGQGPLEVRGEYAHSMLGQGFWLEGAYRFSRLRGPDSLLGRFQLVGRAQQYVHGSPDPTFALPGEDSQKAEFGWNYYLPHEVRLNASYGRQFLATGNANIWNFAITYRFLFPLYPGKNEATQ